MILRASVNGATKTRIMYGAYLSYAQVKEYLNFLTQKNLLTDEGGSGMYRLTEDGMRLLRTYEGISDLIAVGSSKDSALQPS